MLQVHQATFAHLSARLTAAAKDSRPGSHVASPARAVVDANEVIKKEGGARVGCGTEEGSDAAGEQQPGQEAERIGGEQKQGKEKKEEEEDEEEEAPRTPTTPESSAAGRGKRKGKKKVGKK